MTPIDRRDALKRLASIGVATTAIGSGVTSAEEYIEPDADAVYVWGPADDILLDSDIRMRFYHDMDAVNASKAYFSWGEYNRSSANGSDLADFIRDARDHGIEIHLTSSLKGEDAPGAFYNDVMFDIIDWMDQHIEPDGVHLDLEPDGGDLATFLDSYETMLTQININSALSGVPLSIAWRLGFTEKELSRTKNVRDHARIDSIVSMSYADSTSHIRNKTEKTMMTGDGQSGRTYSDKEYVVAVEIQPDVNPDITLYDEGEAKTADVLAALDENPPAGNYTGTAIHDYKALQHWA